MPNSQGLSTPPNHLPSGLFDQDEPGSLGKDDLPLFGILCSNRTEAGPTSISAERISERGDRLNDAFGKIHSLFLVKPNSLGFVAPELDELEKYAGKGAERRSRP
jgi:hypothetical protein